MSVSFPLAEYEDTYQCRGLWFESRCLPLPSKLTLRWDGEKEEIELSSGEKDGRLLANSASPNSPNHDSIADSLTQSSITNTLSTNTTLKSPKPSAETTPTATGDFELVLDYARFGEKKRFEEMLQRMVEEEDNIGEDEFEDEDIEEMWSLAETFILKDGDVIKAFIVVQPCFTSRTIDACQFTPFIVYDTAWMKSLSSFFHSSFHPSIPLAQQLIYLSLVDLSIKLATEAQMGYTDCLLRVAPDSNAERVALLVEKGGFQVVSEIPRSVLVNGKLLRHLVLVKNFAPLRGPRTEEEVVKMVDKTFPASKCDPIFDLCTLPQIPTLPRIYILPHGRMFYLRNSTKEDSEWLYGLMHEASRESKGYGLHEFPTLASFKVWMMMENHVAVYHIMQKQDFYKQKDGGVITHKVLMSCLKDREVLESLDLSGHPKAAGTFVSDSWHVRSRMSNAAETCLILDPKFRNQGLGKELVKIELGLVQDLGFDMMVNDALSNNVQMLKSVSNASGSGFVYEAGSIPNVCYVVKEGKWIGQEIHIYDFKRLSIPSLSQLLDSNNDNALALSTVNPNSEY